jgi:hypothetical protein
MENSKHCEICDLSSFNLHDGIVWSLTDKKANFIKKCPDIQLDKKMKEKLIEINTEFQDSKYVKKLAIGNIFFYGLIGLAVLYLCYYLSFKLLELGVFHTGTIVIFVIGIFIVGIGFGTLNYSRQKSNVSSPKKINLDMLTELYQIRYLFESNISTDVMGIKETKIKLIVNGETIEKVSRYLFHLISETYFKVQIINYGRRSIARKL